MKKWMVLYALIALTIFNSCKETFMPYRLPYGAFFNGQQTEFKLYAPTSSQVYLVLFDSYDAQTGKEIPMARDEKGDWSLTLKDAGIGTLYGYRLEGPQNDPKVIVADPWTQAAVTQNTYRHIAKSLIIDHSYDWEDDRWQQIDPHDLIIYEMHVRDMTAHPTSGCPQPGTYSGLVNPNQSGGITHLKNMGINTVQILPVQDFANVEIPYKDESAPIYNTWNPYARNHWGYMTTFFFAPETYYGSDGTMKPEAWNGVDGRAVKELKDMVKAFHKEDIAVIMDVVYNHVSNYDWNPLKYIDKETYFRLNQNGEYISQSGCGNDCQTEHAAMRQLILESLKYWMQEYHVDGFRFDLGYLIDPETRALIIKELRAINPNVIILAEPWGGGYDPFGFSDQGWASFNDQIRNSVKGQNPTDGQGFIFGKWQGNFDAKALQRFAMGSLRKFGGQYVDAAHSVNYLESHDDNTFGDFIRLATGQVTHDTVITDRMKNAEVRESQLALNKLGALYLFTSQGITFIHQGQEWARSKVVADSDLPDVPVGHIDHNSYNKDDETNWLNWDERDINPDLVNYYKGLIQLRKKYPSFRHSNPEDFNFYDVESQVALVYELRDKFIVAMNGDPGKELNVALPAGDWKVIANSEKANIDDDMIVSGAVQVSPICGVILKQKL